MCRNPRTLAELFARHNVKLGLSGHLHQVDAIQFHDLTFVCDGAVSGGWWKGSFKGFGPGYGSFDLSADGKLRHQYCDYGWTPKK